MRKSTRTLFALVTATIAIGTNGDPTPAGAESNPDDRAPTPISPEHWAKEYHYASTPDISDPALAEYAKLTGLSAEDAQFNLQLQDEVNLRLSSMSDGLRDRYAGAELLNAKGGGVRLYVTDAEAAQEFVDGYAQSSGMATYFDYVIVRHNQRQLDNFVVTISTELDALGPGSPGAERAIISEDTVSNGVLVEYDADLDQKSIDDLQARYGSDDYPALRFERLDHDLTGATTSCPSHSSCDPPIRGGLRLDGTVGQTGSSGFNATRNSDGGNVIVTAGHIVDHQGEEFYHNRPSSSDDFIGSVEWYGFNSTVDAARIYFRPEWSGSPINTIFRDSNAAFGITSKVTSPALSSYICRSGYVAAETCGTIISTNSSKSGVGNLLRIEHARSCHGDSGGPWFSTANAAYGIQSSTDPIYPVCADTPFSADSWAVKVGTVESSAAVVVRVK